MVKGLTLNVKVIETCPFNKDYCRFKVGDQFGTISLHVFGSYLVLVAKAKAKKSEYLTLKNVKFKLDSEGKGYKCLRADQGESTITETAQAQVNISSVLSENNLTEK